MEEEEEEEEGMKMQFTETNITIENIRLYKGYQSYAVTPWIRPLDHSNIKTEETLEEEEITAFHVTGWET